MASGPTFNKQRGFWYVEYHDGRRKRRVKVAKGPPRWQEGDPRPKVAPPEAKAAFNHWQEIEKEARAGRDKGLPTSLEDFLREHVETYLKPGTKQLVRLAVDHFLAWCRQNNVTQFNQVDKRACNRFLRWAARHPGPAGDPGGPPVSRDTLKVRRAFIAAAWGKLIVDEVISKNPWKGTETPGEDRTKPKNAWTWDQYQRLLGAADPWLRDVLVFGVNTGLRIQTIRLIEWRDWIHPEPGERHLGHLQVRKEITKTEAYRVPISEELHDLLSRRIGEHDPTFILTATMGKPFSATSQTHRAIVAACIKAELPKPQSPNHHMRRTFGRFAVRGQLTGQPVPIYLVSKWLGHANPKTTMIYLDLEEEESVKFMVPRLYSPALADSTTTPEAIPES